MPKNHQPLPDIARFADELELPMESTNIDVLDFSKPQANISFKQLQEYESEHFSPSPESDIETTEEKVRVLGLSATMHAAHSHN